MLVVCSTRCVSAYSMLMTMYIVLSGPLPENSMDVEELIKRLLSDHSKLTYPELVTVLNKLKSVLNVSVVTPSLGLALISIISEILESDSDLTPFTNL